MTSYFFFEPSLSAQSPNFLHFFVSQLGIWSALSIRVAHFLVHIMDVIKMRPQKQVIGIYTSGIVATMKNVEGRGDFAIVQTEAQAVYRPRLAFDAHYTIAKTVSMSHPEPTITDALSVNVLPEFIFCWAIGHNSTVVSKNKANWLTFHPSVLDFVALGNRCFLPTTAVAIAVGNIVRGIMGLHKKFTFLVPSLGTVTAVAGALRVRFYSFILAQKGYSSNALEADYRSDSHIRWSEL